MTSSHNSIQPGVYAVGYGGSMIWLGSSAGVAMSNLYPEAKSVGRWVRHGPDNDSAWPPQRGPDRCGTAVVTLSALSDDPRARISGVG
jgi:hypothetical protein